jgi:hypothetical protein
MKRNKPLVKRRNSGTQSRRRRPYWFDQRSTEDWTVIAPQSLVGKDARTFSMEGAVPAGKEGLPDDPTFARGLYRWRLDFEGQSVLVYTRLHGWYSWYSDGGFSGVPRTGDVWYAFTAVRRCDRPRCSLTRYFYSDSDAEIALHRPGHCPLGVPGAGVWKYVARLVL